MLKLASVRRLSSAVRVLAARAVPLLPAGSPARDVAERAMVHPLDYMRYAEFDAILRDLTLAPGMRVLDVSSPQWFSILLAAWHPGVAFHYVNILAAEREPFQQIATALGLANLTYAQEDVRSLTFAAASFDRVISISVIEHVYPEEGGDVAALVEIRRVLKPGGECLLTLPYKDKRNVVYMDGPVYEREGGEHTFFAREYDADSFADLVRRAAMSVHGRWLISERPGILALDYYEWGPGRDRGLRRYHWGMRRRWERLLGRPAEDLLAWWYLRVGQDAIARSVNIAATILRK